MRKKVLATDLIMAPAYMDKFRKCENWGQTTQARLGGGGGGWSRQEGGHLRRPGTGL